MTDDEIKALIEKRITERLQNIGIDDTTFAAQQTSRANFTLLDAIRVSRDAKQISLSKSFREVLTGLMGNAAWFIVAALLALGFTYLKGHWH